MIKYPDSTIYEYVRYLANKRKNLTAIDYFSRKYTYEELMKHIDRCAVSLLGMGVKKGDVVSLIVPNIPQGVFLFYAINKIGAVANMIHPLSAPDEIDYFIELTETKVIFALDMVEPKLADLENKVEKIVLMSPGEYMNLPMKMAIKIKGSGVSKESKRLSHALSWKDFMKYESNETIEVKDLTEADFHEAAYFENAEGKVKETSTILYSGGTTGKPKGIELTNLNFNALGLTSLDSAGCLKEGMRFLSVMPIFHGFGLGVCIHSVFLYGGCAILLPKFNPKEFHKLIIKHKPAVVAGVPAIYETFLRHDEFDGVDLSFLKLIISGGDSLSVSTKQKMNEFLRNHGCKTNIREGYGLTECVTGTCLMPDIDGKYESVGKPYADTVYKIWDSENKTYLPLGEKGEIILSSPMVMKSYLKEPEETADTLVKHDDGKVYLHTGDIGYMDKEGFVYFAQRQKRMIISNGYNIYPQVIEEVINQNKDVVMCCVVGVPDAVKGEKAIAFVVLKDKNADTKSITTALKEAMEQSVAGYAIPRQIIFKEELPKTKVGKIAYTELIKEYLADK